MNFVSFCDNKGCHKEMKPVIDKETLVAYCTECGKSVNNISIFMRRQLVANGQVRRNEKKRMPWAVKCSHCDKEGPPELHKDGSTLVCSFCQKTLDNLSRPFAEALRMNLKSQKKSED